MSLAHDFLREYLANPEFTQADFARACGMTAPNVSDLIKGDVAISGRNMTKLLRGFRLREDRVAFLAAYIRDEIPAEHADDITIQITDHEREGSLHEGNPGEELQAALLMAFRALPSDSYRQRVVTLVRALRGDDRLRELFKTTVDYLQPDEAPQATLAKKVADNAINALDKAVDSLSRPVAPKPAPSPKPAAPESGASPAR